MTLAASIAKVLQRYPDPEKDSLPGSFCAALAVVLEAAKREDARERKVVTWIRGRFGSPDTGGREET